jgi:hypothetical protein
LLFRRKLSDRRGIGLRNNVDADRQRVHPALAHRRERTCNIKNPASPAMNRAKDAFV